MNALLRLFLRADRFITGIIIALVLGLSIPCVGLGASIFDGATQVAIFSLFFLYGVKLSRQSIVQGLLHWKLQLLVVFFTFAFFPLLMLSARPLLEPLTSPALYMGLLYVAALPATVQSSIIFTSVAGGNIPSAVCSASLSSLIGVFLTPILVGMLFAVDSSGVGASFDSFFEIALLILLPFVLGQLAQPFLANWAASHKGLISWNDQITIWLVVYTSFSEATAAGYWKHLSYTNLGGLILASFLLLCLIHATIYYTAKLFGFNLADRITLVFCGSKKSLAVGASMLVPIFGFADNNLLLPLLIFHQVQIMTCSHLSRMWKNRREKEEAAQIKA